MEHIAVVLLRQTRQAVQRPPEGGKNSLDNLAGERLIGDARHHGQGRGQQHRHNQDNAKLGTEQMSHWVSSISWGACFFST